MASYDFENLDRLQLTEKSRQSIFTEIRELGPALRKAKQLQKGMTNEPLAKRWQKSGIKGPKSGIFDDVNNFLTDRYVSAANSLHYRVFTVNYNLYGYVDREAVLSENTVGLSVDVQWRLQRVVVKVTSGIPTPITLKPAIMSMLKEGSINKSELVKIGNFDDESIKNMPQQNHHKLLNVIKSALGGQNLLTRLVKGVLLILDLEFWGSYEVTSKTNSIQFSINGLLKLGVAKQAAFVYCSVPSSAKYAVFLNAMAGKYPCPDIISHYSHISIPSDGNVFVVSDSELPEYTTATISAEEARASLITYARCMGVMNQMEKATLIAMSLTQNRYLSQILLPEVLCYADLVRPLMVSPPDSNASYPLFNRKSGIVAGKVHQMSIFTVIKDVIVSVRSTVQSGNWYSQALSSIKSKEKVLSEINTKNLSLQLLSRTNEMNWWSGVTSQDLEKVDDITVFEALWLYNNATDGLFAGVFQHRFKGDESLHPTGSKFAYNVIVEELLKGGVKQEDIRIKDIAYIVDAPSIEPAEDDNGFEEFEKVGEMEL